MLFFMFMTCLSLDGTGCVLKRSNANKIKYCSRYIMLFPFTERAYYPFYPFSGTLAVCGAARSERFHFLSHRARISPRFEGRTRYSATPRVTIIDTAREIQSAADSEAAALKPPPSSTRSTNINLPKSLVKLVILGLF